MKLSDYKPSISSLLYEAASSLIEESRSARIEIFQRQAEKKAAKKATPKKRKTKAEKNREGVKAYLDELGLDLDIEL